MGVLRSCKTNRLLKMIKFQVDFRLNLGHQKKSVDFNADPGGCLIYKCDENVRQAHENISKCSDKSNIKFLGCFSMKVDDNL